MRKRFSEKFEILETLLLILLKIIVIPTVFLIIFCSLTWFYVGSILSTSIAGIYLMLKSITKQRKIDIHNAILFNHMAFNQSEWEIDFKSSYNDKYRRAHLNYEKPIDGEYYDFLYKIYEEDLKKKIK